MSSLTVCPDATFTSSRVKARKEFANACTIRRYVPGGSCAMEYSPAAEAMPWYATLVAALTTRTGTLTAWPSGSVMAPEIVPVEDCCAVRFEARREKRSSHRMDGLYMADLVA